MGFPFEDGILVKVVVEKAWLKKVSNLYVRRKLRSMSRFVRLESRLRYLYFKATYSNTSIVWVVVAVTPMRNVYDTLTCVVIESRQGATYGVEGIWGMPLLDQIGAGLD